MSLRIPLNYCVFFSCFLTFFFLLLAFAQWEAQQTKIGQSQGDGFDYECKNFTSSKLGPLTFTYTYAGARSMCHAPVPYVLHSRNLF